MLYQAPTGLDQTLLQASQRPIADRFGQCQPPLQVAKVVGDDTQSQPHFIGAEAMTAKPPRHRDGLLALFNPLFGGTSPVVEAHQRTEILVNSGLCRST